MVELKDRCDVVVIGAGMGGLTCGGLGADLAFPATSLNREMAKYSQKERASSSMRGALILTELTA